VINIRHYLVQFTLWLWPVSIEKGVLVICQIKYTDSLLVNWLLLLCFHLGDEVGGCDRKSTGALQASRIELPYLLIAGVTEDVALSLLLYALSLHPLSTLHEELGAVLV
jgi:hypothetical protein